MKSKPSVTPLQPAILENNFKILQIMSYSKKETSTVLVELLHFLVRNSRVD